MDALAARKFPTSTAAYRTRSLSRSMSLRSAFVLFLACAFVAPTLTSCSLFKKSSSDEDDDEDEAEEREKRRKKQREDDAEKLVATATAPTAVPSPIPTAVTPPTSPADSTGVAECDDLVAKMVLCAGTSQEDAARMRAGYRQGAAVARESIAQGCRSALAGNPILQNCSAATAGSAADCIKLVACCRAITLNATADAKLNVRMGTASREDSLKSCDELATAPTSVCLKAYETTKNAVRTQLPPNVQEQLAAACP
jgi:hypothetical protein